jgi:cytochrome c oxidase assembly protein Cox11
LLIIEKREETKNEREIRKKTDKKSAFFTPVSILMTFFFDFAFLPLHNRSQRKTNISGGVWRV